MFSEVQLDTQYIIRHFLGFTLRSCCDASNNPEDDTILEIEGGISLIVLLSSAEETHCTYTEPQKASAKSGLTLVSDMYLGTFSVTFI